MSPRRSSDMTFTDQFCGAGGSSIGAVKAGLRGRMALNHWALAIETHNTNFPDIDHDCTDVSAADPRRYPSTDILITSPECTTHSPAGGSRRSKPQRDLFIGKELDPATQRSRATMWDVVRFAEFHEYRLIITENVFEVTRWPLFSTWLLAMENLGYRWRVVSLNSQFCHPTPQSRDRVYIVFWRKGNRAPMLDHTAPAPCPRCEKVVTAIQAWKPQRRWGKYRQQYEYQCRACRTAVTPFYFAALNALDLTIPGERIGDRKKPLKARTMERIRYGLDKYGRTALVVSTRYKYGHGFRVHDALSSELPTQPADPSHAMALAPGFLVEKDYSHAKKRRARGVEEPMPAQTGRVASSLVQLPFLLSNQMSRRVNDVLGPLPTQCGSREHDAIVTPVVVSAGSNETAARPADGPAPAMTGSERFAVVVPMRHHNTAKGVDEPLDGVGAQGQHHMLVSGAALVTMRSEGNMARGLDGALPAQVASCTQDWLVQPSPFLLSYYGQGGAAHAGEPVPTITTLERHALVEPDVELAIEDCFFRMLAPHEIGAAMAFPGSYTVLGNKRDQVKQYGNAVTPPAKDPCEHCGRPWGVQR